MRTRIVYINTYVNGHTRTNTHYAHIYIFTGHARQTNSVDSAKAQLHFRLADVKQRGHRQSTAQKAGDLQQVPKRVVVHLRRNLKPQAGTAFQLHMRSANQLEACSMIEQKNSAKLFM